MRPTPGKKQRTQQRGANDKPYRRGETLGKAMRRGKLAKGAQAGAAQGKAAAAAGAVDAGAQRKGKAPARAQEDSEAEQGDEEMSEEEWGGVESEEEDVKDDEPVQRAPPVVTDKRRVPRKAGGTGKKHKVFVEEKSDLLSLAASITGQAEAKTKERLDRAKNKPVAPVKSGKNEPSEAKQKQLAAARAIVAARTKANKERKKEASTPKTSAPAPAGGRKKVSFA